MAELREVRGYIALALLGLYWLWVVCRTAPQLRKGVRDRGLRLRAAGLRTATLVLVALAVAEIHFWGTEWWHIVIAAVGAIGAGLILHRAYRRLVAAPRHRITLRQRALGHHVRVPAPHTGDDAFAAERARHRRAAPPT